MSTSESGPTSEPKVNSGKGLNSHFGSSDSGAKSEPKVRFSKGLALAGLVGGVVIAVGLPALLILFGQFLGAGTITALTIIALITGGGLATVSAFFGTIMPSRAG